MYRRTYWSNTGFADWVRGVKKPCSETPEGWSKWEIDAKKKNRLRFWMSDSFLDFLQDIFMFPMDKLYSLKYYIVNRWIDQSHALVAHKKNIPRGQWRDLDDRMIYCLFDELVDFVEIEKASRNFSYLKEQKKTMGFWRSERNPKAGIDYLKWEASLTDDENVPTSQAVAATEILELYHWWTVIRPARPDPMKESGWSDHCNQYRDQFFLESLRNDVDTGLMLDIMKQMEEDYHNEDTSSLIRLIKLRGHLWT